MATKQVEARLTVKAINQLSGPLKQMGADAGAFGKKAKAELGKLDDLRGPVKVIEDFRKVSAATLSSSRALKEQKKTVRDLAAQFKGVAEPTRKMRDELEKAQRQVKKTAAELKKNRAAFGEVKSKMGEFGITTSNVAAKERELAQAIGKVNSKLDSNYRKFKKNAELQKKWQSAKQQFGQSMNAATGMTATGASMTYTGQRMMRSAYDPINEAASFDEAMQGVRAVTRTFSTSKMPEAERKQRDSDYAKLRDLARRLGETTSFTNVEAANAEKFLGMAGMGTGDIISSMPSVLNLSKAGSTDLARTADISSNVMSAWGKSGEEMGHIADVMVGTFTRANVNIEQIGESMKVVGPKAKQAGLDFEYVNAAIGKLGDAGLQGSLAGTGLRATISRLAGPPKATAKALAKLGVSTKDANGNLRPMPQLLDEIYVALQKFGTADQAAMTKAIGGEYGSAALTVLLERRKEIDELTTVLKNNKDESAELARVMMDQAKGDEAITKSALSALKTEIGSQLMPEYRELQKTIAGALNSTREWAAANPELTQTFIKLGAAVGGLLAAGGAAMFAMAGVAGSIALLKFAFKGAALAKGFQTFGSALDDYSVKAEKAAVKTRSLKSSAKGLVGKAGLLNAVTLGFAAYETGQAFSEMKRLDEMSPEEKAVGKKALDDKLAAQSKAAESLPGIGWLYEKTMSARKAMFGDGEPKGDLAAKRDDLADLDRRIAALKRTAIGPDAGEMLTGPLQQQRAELVAEIDKLSQGMATAGLDEATRMQADGVRASGLPEAMRQTADQIRALSFASASGGAAKASVGDAPARALGGSVRAGQTYQINEHGRSETLVSDLSGRILSHSDSMRAMRAAAQGSSGGAGGSLAGAARVAGQGGGGMPDVHMHLSLSPQISIDASGQSLDEASLAGLVNRQLAQFANSPQMAGAMREMLNRLWRETQLTSYQNGALV